MPGTSFNVRDPYNAADYLPVHGNYCGPGWTGGQRVRPGQAGNFDVEPADYIDRLCKEHDQAYAQAADTANPAMAANIVLEADTNLVRDAYNLLARGEYKGSTIDSPLSMDEMVYAQLTIDAFVMKITTVDSANVIKGEMQGILKDLVDSIKKRGGVPVTYNDGFGTSETLTAESDGSLELTGSTVLDNGATMRSESSASPNDDTPSQQGVVSNRDGSVDVAVNGDGANVDTPNADVYVAPGASLDIDVSGTDVFGSRANDIDVHANNTDISTNQSEITFYGGNFSGDSVSGSGNTIIYEYQDSKLIGGDDEASTPGGASYLGAADGAQSGDRGRRVNLGARHRVKVEVSSDTPVSIEHLVQSIAAFGNTGSGVVDGFAFSNAVIAAPVEQSGMHQGRLLSASH